MEKSKKKVLFLITKSNWGGAQRYVYDLAIGLPEGEFEAAAAVGGSGLLSEHLRQAGLRVISLPSLQRDISVAKEIRSIFELWRVIRTEKPDILHINSSKAGILGALIGRIARVPTIVFTSHGWAFNEDRPRWQKIILKKIHWLTVLLAHHTIAVSRELKRQMTWPFAQKKITVIHNGRSITNLLSQEESRIALIEKEPRLAHYKNDFWSLTIGELHPVKRHSAVIEVMKELVEKSPDTRHLIIGSGEDEQVLEIMIAEQNLGDNIFLLGPIEEASKYLKAADLFILPSRSEGMPYVLIEALIAGVPIIATRVGGIPEVVEDGISGLLIPPLDNKALFEAILRVRTDTQLRQRLSQSALERSSDFTFAQTLKQTIAVYKISS